MTSTESECAAVLMATTQAIWLQNHLKAIGYEQSTTTIKEENQGAIKYAYSQNSRGRMRHSNPAFTFICEQIEDETIKLQYVSSLDNYADILTKTLRGIALTKHSRNLGLTNNYRAYNDTIT
jgi:hypothetical protein